MTITDEGEVTARIPVPGSDADVEPDTGHVWVTGAKGNYRLDTDGRVVSSQPLPEVDESKPYAARPARWLFVVPPGK